MTTYTLMLFKMRPGSTAEIGEGALSFDAGGDSMASVRVRWQVETKADPERRLDFCCDLIAKKVGATINTMKTALPDSRWLIRRCTNSSLPNGSRRPTLWFGLMGV